MILEWKEEQAILHITYCLNEIKRWLNHTQTMALELITAMSSLHLFLRQESDEKKPLLSAFDKIS